MTPQLDRGALDRLAVLVDAATPPLGAHEDVGAWIERQRVAAAALLDAAPSLIAAAHRIDDDQTDAEEAPNGTKAKCRGCGRAIVWGKTTDGQAIPLDAVAPVYELDERTIGGVRQQIIERTRTAFVSHFVTCPERAQFKRPKP